MNRFRWHKGRASLSNPAGRFEAQRHEAVDDGWPDPDAGAEPTPRTRIHPDAARRVITRNDSPDVPFDRSVNPYRGCEHGCIYCFARPYHGYLGLSSGLDFETELFAKPRAAERVAEALDHPRYRPEVLALGTATDPYQPVERRLRITRAILEVLSERRHPVALVTKSDGVLRDLDLLAPMAKRRLVRVLLSVTTLDGELARHMEPRASAPHRRLAAMQRLSDAGIEVGLLASPMIPGLNDHELERIVAAAARAGARSAATLLVRLPHEVKDLFVDWLREHHPGRAERVLGLIRSCRGGALSQSEPGARMRGTGPYAQLLHQRMQVARRRHGLRARPEPLDTGQFVRTTPTGQLPLFH